MCRRGRLAMIAAPGDASSAATKEGILNIHGLPSAPSSPGEGEAGETGLPALLGSTPRGVAARSLVGQLRHHHAPTAAHCARVARVLMRMWARAPDQLGDPETLLIAGALHDIGKLFVPASTLGSDRALDEDGLATIRRHPETGAEVLRSLGFPLVVVAAARDHHERWQGGGYPVGGHSEDLHVVARATAVADAYVAMVEPGRAYRTPLTDGAALAELRACRGTHFDPVLADILLVELAERAAAGLALI